MSKLPKSEVFSVLHMPELQDAPLPPVDAAHALFRSLRPHLERQPWDQRRSDTNDGTTHYTRDAFSRREMTVDYKRRGFRGDLAWLVSGPPALTLSTDHPTTAGRVKETLHVNSPDWRQQATVEFTRSVMHVGVIDLDNRTFEEPYLSDLRSVDITVEADAPNNTDRLRIGFSASAFFPRGHRGESARVINGAHGVYAAIDLNDRAAIEAYHRSINREDMNSGPGDIVALRESVSLLQNALTFLRQPPLS